MTGDGRTISDGRGVADGRYTAVVDRFEEPESTGGDPRRDPAGGESGRDATGSDPERDRELAVLLLESDESVVAERTVPSWRLPADARRPDAVLAVVVRNGFVVSLGFDRAATERRRSSAQARFDRLAERPPGEESDDGS